MILIIGGIASGKRTFARTLGYDDVHFSTEIDDGKPVLIDAQELPRACDSSLESLAYRISESKQVVLIVDVGSGIVPMERDEREWRDDVGHLGGFLASRADTVIRMVCGIPVVLKGELPKGGTCK